MPEIRIIEDYSTETCPYMKVEVDCLHCGQPYVTQYNYKTAEVDNYMCYECECIERGIDPYNP